MVDDFIASRQVFGLKCDSPSTDLLRHDIVVRNGLIYRFSRVANPDLGMIVERDIIDLVLKAGVPAIPVKVQQTERDTYQWMRRARGDAVADLPLEQKRAVWSQLASTLRRLHGIKGKGAGLLVSSEPRGVWSVWEVYVKWMLTEHALYALQNGLLSAKIAGDVLECFVGWLPEPQVEGSLLHGDLNDHNVFAQDGLTDIIDWEDALVGDPIFELASWCCFTGHPEEEWAGFLDAYYGGVERPADFERLFGLYLLRIALARLVQLHRQGFTELERGKVRIKRALERLK